MNIIKQRRVASKKGTLDSSTSATLRRRAHDLQVDEGFADDYVKVFLRAADELDALKQKDDAQTILNLTSDCRKLRQALTRVYPRVHASTAAKDIKRLILDDIRTTLSNVPEFGANRRIMTVRIGDVRGGESFDYPREHVEAEVKRLLDAYYNPPTEEPTNGEKEGTAHEARTEDGGPATEQPQAAGGDRDPEGTGERSGSEDGETAR